MNLEVTVRLDQVQSGANVLSALNDVPIKMIIGSDAHVVRLSSVPVVGERIAFNGQDWTVRDVKHTPGRERAAEVTVVIVVGSDS